jgi:elongation factor G
VTGRAPLKEIQGYHSRLKSLTGGDGSFTMDFSHYAEVPREALDQVASQN